MRTAEARQLFDANAATYDRVNTAVSMGLDRRWRRWLAKQAVAAAPPGLRQARVLDAMGGTGLVGVEAAALGARVVVADASRAMLAEARRHAEARGVHVLTVETDVARPHRPCSSRSFDAVTCCFGVRYLEDPAKTLRSLAGVLRPGGRLAVMEFVSPDPRPVPMLAAAYFFGALPKLASALAGPESAELYRYLAASTRRLGRLDDLRAIVRDAGIRELRSTTLGFGLVGAVVGVRD